MTRHNPIPKLIDEYHRWKCAACKRWVNYSEANGEWWHERVDE